MQGFILGKWHTFPLPGALPSRPKNWIPAPQRTWPHEIQFFRVGSRRRAPLSCFPVRPAGTVPGDRSLELFSRPSRRDRSLELFSRPSRRDRSLELFSRPSRRDRSPGVTLQESRRAAFSGPPPGPFPGSSGGRSRGASPPCRRRPASGDPLEKFNFQGWRASKFESSRLERAARARA